MSTLKAAEPSKLSLVKVEDSGQKPVGVIPIIGNEKQSKDDVVRMRRSAMGRAYFLSVKGRS